MPATSSSVITASCSALRYESTQILNQWETPTLARLDYLEWLDGSRLVRQPQGKRERETPVVKLRNEAVLISNG